MNSLKSIILSITLLFSISNSHATSQQEQETLSYLKNSFSQVDIKRISRISQEMSLDIPTAEKFWPRYQEYLHRLIALRDKQLATLSSYASHVNDKKLDIKVAKTLLKERLAEEELRVTIRKKLVTGMHDILTPIQQMRLYQIELLLDAELRAGLLSQVPLAE